MTKSFQLVLLVLMGAYILHSSRQGSKITEVTMQCENDQIDVDFEPDQSPAEANDVTGKSLAETSNVVIAAVAQNGTDSMKPGTTATKPKGGALAAAVVEDSSLAADDEPEEIKLARPLFFTEREEAMWEEVKKIPEEERTKYVNTSANPQCTSPKKGDRSPCEERKCRSIGTRKKDGRMCSPTNCYCRCVPMSTGGRYCDEWVAEGCQDNDGCFRAEDFEAGLTHPAGRDALKFRIRHPDVVLTAAMQTNQANQDWRKAHNFQGHLIDMLLAGEIEAIKELAHQRFDLPMLHKARQIEYLATELQKTFSTSAEAAAKDANHTALEKIIKAKYG